ncbi:amidohydrolase family protein [bacterium]|nr:amidohydrolase family protein [bacterium]
MMRRSGIVCSLFFALFLSQLGYTQTIAIRAGNLIDPATGSVSKNQTILINGERIAEVGRNINSSRADRVLDLSDSWVMPGLMDAHVHLTFGLTPYVKTNPDWEMYFLKESTAYRALRGIRNAQRLLESGFTTVKDIGNDANYAATDIRKAIENGLFKGPTIFNTGKIIAAFGGQSEGFSPEQGPFWQFEYIDADTPDEIRKAVRRNIYYGANTIKLVADNGVFFYNEDEIRAAVTETHKAGLTIAIHVMGGEAARNVIMGGSDSIEHGFELSDELLTLMKEKGVVLVGTDFPYEHLRAMGSSDKEARELSERIADRLKRAHRIGVKMAFGTDAILDLPGMHRGQMSMDYLAIWEAAGIPASKILKCMTTNVAELLRIQDERGAIAAGQYADVVATPTNPLENIQALQSVHFVMKNGHIIKTPDGSDRLTRK